MSAPKQTSRAKPERSADRPPSSSAAAPKELAPYHLRLFALIIDYMLVGVLFKLLVQVFLGRDWDLQPGFVENAGAGPGWLALMGAAIVAKDVWRGRSVGKWITGIAVGLAENPARPPPVPRLLARNLWLILFPVEAVLVFFDRYSRRLGDRFTGTVVVVPALLAPAGRRLLMLSILFLLSILAAFLITSWNLKRSAAYKTARAEAETRQELTEAAGEGFHFGFSPELELSISPAGGRATVLLLAEGNKGEIEVEVKLILQSAPPAWRVQSVRILDPGGEGETRR